MSKQITTYEAALETFTLDGLVGDALEDAIYEWELARSAAEAAADDHMDACNDALRGYND